MKKIILIIIISFVGFVGLQAQSLAGYKILINPGHGGHDSDDREIPLGNGITFWESDGNLSKGLYVKAMLENLGAKVVMSRTTNNTADDLPLSQIVAIANTNNVDYFHAIHSNATGTATRANYTLILFQGRTSAPTYPGSLTMANFLADNILKADRTIRNMIAGDFDFYGTGQAYLGVFKGLSMPGTLSEGSFHDYIPEAFRLKSESYLKHEAWAITRSFLQYFNGGTLTDGIIAGIVRDIQDKVPTSYSPLSNTFDNYKPINKIKVTLLPVGKVYEGDSFNNGYYIFDNIQPGNYKLIFEIPGARPDTLNVSLNQNESAFYDKFSSLTPNNNSPEIMSYSPSDSINVVSNISNIVFEFNNYMNYQETQKAFSIIPNVEGSFKWENDFKKVSFIPKSSLIPGTKYLVTLSNMAKTIFGVNLVNKKLFGFTTRSQLKLVSIYPRNGDSNIPISVMLRISFEKGLNAITLSQKISLTDSLGNAMSVKADQSKYSSGIIEFIPTSPLTNNAPYKLTVKEGIGDIENVFSKQTYVIDFHTEKKLTFTGNILEGFEIENVWMQPALSPNTKNINTSLTSFSILSTKPKSGDNSGKVEYTFSGTDGMVDIALANPISFGDNPSAEIGIWVFGDASNNVLEYRFVRQNSSEVRVKIDTLNWTGWRLKNIVLNTIPGSGTIQFKSFTIVQTVKGSLSGRLYFDDLMSNIITDIDREKSPPNEFVLEQNFPNPFNPETIISYQISAMSNVSLKIYDLLGREVATLVNETKEPGKYEVKFNAKGFASGMYIYRIQSGKFSASKKLVLLK